MILAGTRRNRLHKLVGLLLYLALSIAGAAILAAYFIVPALLSAAPELRFGAMGVGALLAFPPLVVYCWAPRLMGRLDPEPWWRLALALSFGAFAASGLSALCNTLLERGIARMAGEGEYASDIAYVISTSIGAPIIEETWKGLAVLFAFWLFRRGMDGVADGVMYAIWSALGFATIENIVFYSRAALDEVTGNEGALATVFMIRGVLSPWTHPLYTSMIGLGLGIARETSNARMKRLAPVIGYLAAVILHASWNGAAITSADFTEVLLPLGLVLVFAFVGLFAALASRHRRILREHLRGEVAMGSLTEGELRLVLSPMARLRATIFHGGLIGPRFVATAARLAFYEWHTKRGSLPIEGCRKDLLRLELARLRAKMQRRLSWHR